MTIETALLKNVLITKEQHLDFYQYNTDKVVTENTIEIDRPFSGKIKYIFNQNGVLIETQAQNKATITHDYEIIDENTIVISNTSLNDNDRIETYEYYYKHGVIQKTIAPVDYNKKSLPIEFNVTYW